MSIKQRFNVKNVEGWGLVLLWLLYFTVAGPYLMSADSWELVILGLALTSVLLLYTLNYIKSRFNEE